MRQRNRKKSRVICGIRESKRDSVEESKNSPFNCIIQDRKGNKQLGMGFLVNKILKVTSTILVKERFATMTVTKNDKFKYRLTPTGDKIFRFKKKQCELSIVNVLVFLRTSELRKNRKIVESFFRVCFRIQK